MAKRVVVLPLWGWIALFGIELAASSNWGDAISASGLIILGIVNSRIRRNAHIDGSGLCQVEGHVWVDPGRCSRCGLWVTARNDGLAAYTADGGNALPEDDSGD